MLCPCGTAPGLKVRHSPSPRGPDCFVWPVLQSLHRHTTQLLSTVFPLRPKRLIYCPKISREVSIDRPAPAWESLGSSIGSQIQPTPISGSYQGSLQKRPVRVLLKRNF